MKFSLFGYSWLKDFHTPLYRPSMIVSWPMSWVACRFTIRWFRKKMFQVSGWSAFEKLVTFPGHLSWSRVVNEPLNRVFGPIWVVSLMKECVWFVSNGCVGRKGSCCSTSRRRRFPKNQARSRTIGPPKVPPYSWFLTVLVAAGSCSSSSGVRLLHSSCSPW